MEAITFALIAYFTWGSGVFVEAIAARRIKPYSFIFWALSLAFLISSFYTPFVIKDLNNFTINILILNIALSAIGVFGIFIYLKALQLGNRMLVGTITNSFPVVVVLLSIIFLGEKISLQQIGTIFLIFAGLFLSTFDISSLRKKHLIVSKGVFLAFIAMISWGIWFTFLKIPVNIVGWFWPNYITFALFPLVYLFMRMNNKKLEKPTVNGAFFPLVVSTVLLRTAEFSYNIAIGKGLVAIVAPIAGANPTLFVILAFLFFKDPITRQQIAGIITTLIGIVLLSVFSV